MPAKSFVLEDCNFETGKAELRPESYAVLDELVAYLVRKEDERIELGGHTDNVGTAKSNLILSEARANTVRAYVIMKGIDPLRVTAKGYGFTVPVAENTTAEGRAQNRRTEVKILDELVAYLVRKEDERIEIGGHTDNVGTAKSNLILSEARANTVRAYVIMKGIDPLRVTAKGYGFSVPVAENTTAEGRAQNRRTEVKILE